MKYRIILLLGFIIGIGLVDAQNSAFRNPQLNEIITPFRIPLPTDISKIKYEDLDNDGDPDILKSTIPGGIHILWIDDDDDMKKGDLEGDMDNDCVMFDINNDGKYGSEKDLIVDWSDLDGDEKADVQLIVDNNKKDNKGKWTSHYIWFMDTDKDGVFGYVDWKTLKFEGWDHSGRAYFFADYNGKSMMLKVHITTWNIKDLEYNWENPFLFYDEDKDGLTEMAIRMVDEPIKIRDRKDTLLAWQFSHNISMVAMTFDMDNDNKPDNELDFDMSLKFKGKGFGYSDQIHTLKGMKIADKTDKYFDDPRFRHLDKLIYPDHESAYDLIFKKGKWDYCWFVFDEDDDCQRWERVEFYEPGDPFEIGSKKSGLDNNPQADATGDRGEWDEDFSGKGNLYLSPLDGKLHLYGAEYGYWRIDQNALYFQGWQGWRGDNLQPEDFENIEPEKFATIAYEDTDGNGFFDRIYYDMDGNQDFETYYSLIDNGIDDTAYIYDVSEMKYKDYNDIYKKMAHLLFVNAKEAIKVAKKYDLNTEYYSVFMHPKSFREQYHNGYWLSFYIYRDLLKYAELMKDDDLKKKVNNAFHVTNWSSILEKK